MVAMPTRLLRPLKRAWGVAIALALGGCGACQRSADVSRLGQLPIFFEARAFAPFGDGALVGGCWREDQMSSLKHCSARIFQIDASGVRAVFQGGGGMVVGIAVRRGVVFADTLFFHEQLPARRLLRASARDLRFGDTSLVANGELGPLLSSDDSLFYIGDGGLLESADEGATWTPRELPGRRSLATDSIIRSGRDLFVLGGQSFHSVDGGVNWSEMDTGGIPILASAGKHVLGRTDRALVLGVLQDEEVKWGSRLGWTWQYGRPMQFVESGDYLGVLLVPKPGGEVVWLRSRDGGDSWREITVPGAASLREAMLWPSGQGGYLVDLLHVLAEFR
jgi:hypothetical protein